MGQETMNSSERFAQALRLEEPDRVPVAPAISDAGVASLAGYTQAQLAADLDLSRTALFKVFDDFGGWDAMQLGFHDATLGKIAVPMESLIEVSNFPTTTPRSSLRRRSCASRTTTPSPRLAGTGSSLSSCSVGSTRRRRKRSPRCSKPSWPTSHGVLRKRLREVLSRLGAALGRTRSSTFRWVARSSSSPRTSTTIRKRSSARSSA